MRYLLTPWCRVLLEQLTGLQLVKKFPAFRGTRRFITALTSVRHLSLSWASPIQFIFPHPTSWRSILILSTHLRLGLHSGLFPSGFPTKTVYNPLSSPIRATCSAHLNSKSNIIEKWHSLILYNQNCVVLLCFGISRYTTSVIEIDISFVMFPVKIFVVCRRVRVNCCFVLLCYRTRALLYVKTMDNFLLRLHLTVNSLLFVQRDKTCVP